MLGVINIIFVINFLSDIICLSFHYMAVLLFIFFLIFGFVCTPLCPSHISFMLWHVIHIEVRRARQMPERSGAKTFSLHA